MATILEKSRADLAQQFAIDVLGADHVKANEARLEEIGRTFICKLQHGMHWSRLLDSLCLKLIDCSTDKGDAGLRWPSLPW